MITWLFVNVQCVEPHAAAVLGGIDCFLTHPHIGTIAKT
jgi:hypothetical protein